MTEPRTVLAQRVALVGLGILLGLLIAEAGLRGASGWVRWRQSRRRVAGSARAGRPVLRILCLGESTTAPAEGSDWPSQLQEILEDRFPRRSFVVVNEARPSVDTYFILDRAPGWIARDRPDLVISMMGINDMRWWAVPGPEPEQAARSSLEDLRLWRLVQFAVHAMEGTRRSRVADCRSPGSDPLPSDAASLRLCETELREALERHPDAARWRLALSSVLAREGRTQEAGAERARAFETAPRLALQTGSLGQYYLLADRYRMQGRVAAARSACLKGLALDRYWAAGYGCLGNAELLSGHRSRAIGFLQRAAELAPDQLEVAELARQELRHAAEFAVDHGETVPETVSRALSEEPGDFGAPLGAVYERVAALAAATGVRWVAMQYPTLDAVDLRHVLSGRPGFIVVANVQDFRRAMGEHRYADLFTDRFAGTFGHCTRLGNRILARHLADELARAGWVGP